MTDSLAVAVTKFPLISVTGPRQSGKTTLLRQLFKTYRYVTLEDADARSFAQEDPKGFLRTYDRFVIFDEVQQAPHLFSYLQTKTDADRIMGQYILSGSQNFLLLERITQSLAGRVSIYKLLPLSTEELLQDPAGSSLTLPSGIFNGGYPALFDRGLAPWEFFPSYIETYVERDVRQLLNIQDLSLFRAFIRLCAGRVGQLLNLSSLAVETGISVPTARAWMSVLESSYIVFLLPPYFKNFNKRITKSPKLYFYDTGLLCYLLGLQQAEQVENYHQRGSLFENYVLMEQLKRHFNEGRPAPFYFWRDSNGVEIDLVVENGLQLDFFEVKYTYTPTSQLMKNILAVRKIDDVPAGRNTVIYAGEETQQRSDAEFRGWQGV